MISKIGRKVFFINPPESLKGSFLEHVFKREFEIYLLESNVLIERLLTYFTDAIVFIDIDVGLDRYEWVDYIKELQEKYKNVTFTVFSRKDNSVVKKSLLMDVGITGGYILLTDDNWKTVELICDVLEINEARGRRKSVRLDFNKNEQRNNISVKIFTINGYQTIGNILSFSSAGLLIKIIKGKLDKEDNIERIIFKLNDNELHVKGYMFKRFENGNIFITFEEITDEDRDYVQSYIFEHLQKSFKQLIERE